MYARETVLGRHLPANGARTSGLNGEPRRLGLSRLLAFGERECNSYSPRASEERKMRLIQYLDNHGQFDYERYRIAQIKGNHQKIENTWVYKPTIKILSEYILANIEVPKAGICHGTRRGNEQKWFREYLGPKTDVIGTEISNTAAQFLYTIQHDFHDRRSEWVSKFDFAYSNSWDHAYDPAKAFRVWVESLQPHGLL